MVVLMILSASRFSLFLISALSGNKYVFFFVSNHIAVSHSLFPILAVAFIRPQPSSCHFKFSLISLANSIGSETKCQAPGGAYCQTLAENSYLILPRILFFELVLYGQSDSHNRSISLSLHLKTGSLHNQLPLAARNKEKVKSKKSKILRFIVLNHVRYYSLLHYSLLHCITA